MEIRPVTSSYAVSPQIDSADMAAIREAGYTAVINNRPDSEVDAAHSSEALAAAAREAGLGYHSNPVTHDSLTPEAIETQARAAEAAGGPVLAYCASGTRSTVLWALAERDRQTADEILATTARAGYSLENLRPHLERGE